jgi:hypothetical protein
MRESRQFIYAFTAPSRSRDPSPVPSPFPARVRVPFGLLLVTKVISRAIAGIDFPRVILCSFIIQLFDLFALGGGKFGPDAFEHLPFAD